MIANSDCPLEEFGSIERVREGILTSLHDAVFFIRFYHQDNDYKKVKVIIAIIPQVWRRSFTSSKSSSGPSKSKVHKCLTVGAKYIVVTLVLRFDIALNINCLRDADTVLRMFWSQVKQVDLKSLFRSFEVSYSVYHFQFQEGRVPMNKLLVEMLEANSQ